MLLTLQLFNGCNLTMYLSRNLLIPQNFNLNKLCSTDFEEKKSRNFIISFFVHNLFKV